MMREGEEKAAKMFGKHDRKNETPNNTIHEQTSERKKRKTSEKVKYYRFECREKEAGFSILGKGNKRSKHCLGQEKVKIKTPFAGGIRGCE